MLEERVPFLKGEWQDSWFTEDGEIIREDPWRKNQIQNLTGAILMGLLSGKPAWGGIQFLAVGEGLISWDVTPPAQSYDATTLTAEFFRKAVGFGDVTFRDPANPSVIVPDPTRIMQLEVEFSSAEANGTHREFALFGGDANGGANTGQIFNWVVTLPRIEKIAGTILRRQIRITYPAL